MTVSRKVGVLLLAVFVLPFFLNDLWFVPVLLEDPSGHTLVFWDWSLRAVMIGAFLWHPYLRQRTIETWHLKVSWQVAAFWAAGALLFILIASPFIVRVGQAMLGGWSYYSFPFIETTWLRVLDLTLGLMLVAVSEELIARVLFYDVMSQFTKKAALIVVVSALVFALAHWGMGWGAVAGAFFTGILLMMLYLRTGSFLPGVIVHYVENLIIFW